MEIDDLLEPSRLTMRVLVLAVAYFLVVLFAIGVFDLMLSLYGLLRTGEFTDPIAVVELIELVLLLLIIVEVHRTLVAYVQNDPLIRIIVSVAMIAVARQIISYHPADFVTASDALLTALGLSTLLLALLLAYSILPTATGSEGGRD
jgi:uncharacterized membrane protein (DUF373 family)